MRILALALALLSLALPAAAGTIVVKDAMSHPTIPGGTGVVYLTIVNDSGTDDTLTGLSTPVADKAEAHKTVRGDGGILRMEPAGTLQIKAGEALTFGPGRLHVMLTGLKHTLAMGDTFPLTLTFAKAGAVTATVSVVSFKPAPHPMHDMPGMKM